ncbi:TonB-dependent receptor [Massilia sp. H-1]|nr:TonB-dependent receptor [Massilia sp. H-1]
MAVRASRPASAPAPPGRNTRPPISNYRSHSHELELQSLGKKDIDWQLGLYYAAEKNDIRFDIPIFNGTQDGTVGWQGSFIQPEETVASKAAFGQATWNLSDAFHLTGGVRYTQDRRENVGGRAYTWRYDPTVPQLPLNPSMDPRAGPGLCGRRAGQRRRVQGQQGHRSDSRQL